MSLYPNTHWSKSLTLACLCLGLFTSCQEPNRLGGTLSPSSAISLKPLTESDAKAEIEQLKQSIDFLLNNPTQTSMNPFISADPILQKQVQAQLTQTLLSHIQSAPTLTIQGQLLMPQASKGLTGLGYQTVKLFLPDGQEFSSTQTDGQGKFVFKAAPAGLRYEVLAFNPQNELLARTMLDAPSGKNTLNIEISPRSTVLADLIRAAQADGRTGLNRQSLNTVESQFLKTMPNLVMRLESLMQIQYLSHNLNKIIKKEQIKQALNGALNLDPDFSIQNTPQILPITSLSSNKASMAGDLSLISQTLKELPQCNEKEDPALSAMINNSLSQTQTSIIKIGQISGKILNHTTTIKGDESSLTELSNHISNIQIQVSKISSAETLIGSTAYRNDIFQGTIGSFNNTITNTNNNITEIRGENIAPTNIISNLFPPAGPCDLKLLQIQLPEAVPTPKPLASVQPSPTPSPTASPTPLPLSTPSPSPSPSATATGLQIKAYPFPNNEYTQIQLEFTGIPGATAYQIFDGNRLLGKVYGQAGEKLKFLASGLSPDTHYEFRIEGNRSDEPLTGKAFATTWRPSSGSGGGGNPVVAIPPAPTPAAPTITNLSASNGTIGSTLTITGTGFDATPGNNTVRFGTTTATVNTASATSLNVTVPGGIFGSQNVMVTVAGQTNAGTNNYAVTPAIASFNPTSAPIGGSFTINGSGFDTTPGNNTVTLGGTAVTVTGATTTALTVTMPNKVANSYGTTVQVGAQTSASSNMTTLSTITTFAGTGTAGFSGDNGAASLAQINQPWGLEINATGHLAVADSANHRVRFIAGSNATVYGSARTSGHIYTVAGDGTAAFGGDGGTGTAGQLNTPKGVTLSGANNIQLVDSGNARIRLVAGLTGSTFNLAVTAGNLYTLAGTGTAGAATNPVARFAVGDNQNGVEAVARHLNGTLYADPGNQFIRLASLINGSNFGVAVSANTLHNIAGTGTGGFSGDSGAALSANLNSPGGLFNLQSPTATDDNLYLADTANHRIRLVPELAGTYFGQTIAANNIATVAGNGTSGFSGDGGLAINAQLNNPRGVFVNATGLYIADTGNHRIRFVPTASGLYYGQNMTANNIYTLAGTGTAGFNNDGLHASTAHLNGPYGVTVDAALNVYVSDRDNHRIRRISP